MHLQEQHLPWLQDLLATTDTRVTCFDTETDGLDIIKSRPFLFQFGFVTADSSKLYAFAIDLTATRNYRAFIEVWYKFVKRQSIYLGHNVKFDLHMMANIDLAYDHSNLSDTMFYIRFAHDNISARNGGVLLGLKDYAFKYIDPSAKMHDHLIQVERAAIAKTYNLKLKQALGWTIKQMDAFFGDPTNREEDLPSAQHWLAYQLWKKSLPPGLEHAWGKLSTEDIPYTLVNRNVVIHYGIEDIVLTLKVFLKTEPVVVARGNEYGLSIENQCIMPLWKQERIGLELDVAYVNQSYNRMRTYILQRRKDLIDLCGQDITANQNAKILELLQASGINIPGTGEEHLSRLHINYKDHPLIPFVECLRELRTLEKWFVTYLMRFKDKEVIYTTINQVGAASLRMSSDFQQFPKKGLKDKDGNELFNPRRAIKVHTGFDATVYLDYSQIELRVQALYTILVGHPDRNLCRAYMPYECTSVEYGDYDFYNPEVRKAWSAVQWFLKEDPTQLWTPTDVHGATTTAAFNMDDTHPKFKELRSLGKRVNFAKNYGAQYKKISEMFPEYDAETIMAIDQGYYKAFPGIKYYQEYCYAIGRHQSYATNLFGIRYYGVAGHNLINMLIQGGSATFLKLKIIALDRYLTSIQSEVRMVIPVHDEQQFAFKSTSLHIVPKLQEIMEDWEDCLVPIVADAEITHTYWSEKKELAHA